MKKNFFQNILFFFCLSILGNFLLPQKIWAAPELVKSKEFKTVYYIDAAFRRHPFPNVATYQSWYGNDFSKITVLANKDLKNYPLAKNITVRPGIYLVKFDTAPTVYAVAPGGVLRAIANETLVRQIYGQNWSSRLINLPDILFGNYSVGEVIKYSEQAPDGLLYYDKNEATYYYKNNNILQPLASKTAVLANHFKLTDAVPLPDQYYYIRPRPISGLTLSVFNPAALPIVDTRDCENKKLKAAVIFLTDGNSDPAAAEKLEKIKKEIPGHFAWATADLSGLDINYPTVILTNDNYFIKKRSDGFFDVNNEVINSFYDVNPDVFDFIFIWTNFATAGETINEIAHFNPVTNLQTGTNQPLLNNSSVYGSTGKLKGVIMMGNIDKYNFDTPTGQNETLNYAVHEILHQWSAYSWFEDTVDGKKQNSTALLRQPDFQHWSYYAGFISPLGGSGWVDNGDGTFTSALSQLNDSGLRKYSLLDLYLMGLIPYQLVPPVFYVEPTEPGAVGNTIAGQAKWVTIDQIIRANGPIQCESK